MAGEKNSLVVKRSFNSILSGSFILCYSKGFILLAQFGKQLPLLTIGTIMGYFLTVLLTGV